MLIFLVLVVVDGLGRRHRRRRDLQRCGRLWLLRQAYVSVQRKRPCKHERVAKLAKLLNQSSDGSKAHKVVKAKM